MPPKPSKPGTPRELAAMVTRLLQHYWTADDPSPARQAQIEDWIEDLREFQMPVVESAIREWRHTQTRRPLPADIRRLCIEELSQQQFEALPRPTLTDDEIELKARHLADHWAQQNGYHNIDHWALDPVGADLAVRVSPGIIKYFRKDHTVPLPSQRAEQPRATPPQHIATQLGVTAKEMPKPPTPKPAEEIMHPPMPEIAPMMAIYEP